MENPKVFILSILRERRAKAFDNPYHKYEYNQLTEAIEAVESLIPPEMFSMLESAPMTHYEVVKRLTGQIRPEGESDEDRDRLKNLKVLSSLVLMLTTDIWDLCRFANHREASIKKIGELAVSTKKSLLELLNQECE